MNPETNHYPPWKSPLKIGLAIISGAAYAVAHSFATNHHSDSVWLCFYGALLILSFLVAAIEPAHFLETGAMPVFAVILLGLTLLGSPFMMVMWVFVLCISIAGAFLGSAFRRLVDAIAGLLRRITKSGKECPMSNFTEPPFRRSASLFFVKNMLKTANGNKNFSQFSLSLWGLIVAAGAIAATASVLGFFGKYHWFLDLCSHFRVQYCLGLGAVAWLLIVLSKRRMAALFGTLAAINLLVILPLYFWREPVPVVNGRFVRALLANVNTKTGDAAAVATAIRRFNPDIIVLEEVNAKWLSDLKPVLDSYGHSEQEPREDNFGIGLWSRFPFVHSYVAYIGNAKVPSVIAEIETLEGRCTVVATHPLPPIGKAYSDLRNSQLAELPHWVQQASSPVILLGDLNTTPWNHYFKRFLRESGLKNSAQGHGVRPTWPTFNALMRIPIDHCLYSHGIQIVGRQTGPQVGSDHFPVIVDFVIKQGQKAESNKASEAIAE